MSLVEHLTELRRRLLISLAAIAVGTVAGYLWYNVGVFGTPSLGEILKAPYCQLPPENRFGGETGECRLLATAPFEMFMLRLKVGFLAGLVLSAPVWFGQLWGFITPGLKTNEKRWTRSFVTVATLLFAIGAVLAYFVLSFGLDFLLTIGDNTQIAALNGTQYFSFALALLLIFGVSFEVPLVTAMLNLVGVLPYRVLKEKRRIIIMVLFVFAAVITPGQDPVSMVVLAVTLCLMMEIATQFARINDKRRAKRAGLAPEAVDADLADDEASTIAPAAPMPRTGSTGFSGASDIGRPTPVTPARPVNAGRKERFRDDSGRAPGTDAGTDYTSGDLDDIL